MLDPRDQEIEQLRAHIAILEAQIRGLGHDPHPPEQPVNTNKAVETQPAPETRPLKLGEYTRYGRQMILPGFGLPCKLTIVDHDTVELSNLHRQVLHGVDTIGKPKVESAQQALLRLPSFINRL
ncbi:Urmylation protein [Ceratobasidium sp. 414]|nr:Urmylation protein [Ceratobasidium sp. 414]